MKKSRKLNVLICSYSFSNLTGSELCIYDFAKELVKLNCNVIVLSNIVGEPMKTKGKQAGIKVRSMNNPPNYKSLGNGKFIKTSDNYIKFDILHLNHPPVATRVLRLYPNIPAVMHVHSEIIPSMEYPIIHPQVKEYISIRESVTEWIKSFNIGEDKITIIHNPIDISKFNTNYNIENTKENAALFIGTLNSPIRRQMLLDLHEHTKKNNEELWIVGKDFGVLQELTGSHVKYFGEQLNPEEYIKKCKYTAGIMKGRTTIEGWLCGKGGLIYDVDEQGNIKSKKFYDVPNDVNKYDASITTSKLLELYKKVI